MSKTALNRIIQRHIPYIEDKGYVNNDILSKKHTRLYMMHYYALLTANHKEAWAIRKELSKAREQAWRELMPSCVPRPEFRAGKFGHEINCRIQELANVPQSISFALKTITDHLFSYGEGYTFDAFRSSNCSIDQDGDLILRDVVFSI